MTKPAKLLLAFGVGVLAQGGRFGMDEPWIAVLLMLEEPRNVRDVHAVPRCGFGHYLATCIGGSTSRADCYAEPAGGVLDWHWKWIALYDL